MAASPRRGAETSDTRARLLDVTERIMIEHGYAAVSSRRVAKAAAVTPALVHYYFGTLDELFLAILRRRAEQQLERQRRLLATADRPFHILWETTKDPTRTTLVLEFMGLANHRKVIRGELGAFAKRYREEQLAVIRERVEAGDLDVGDLDPLAILVLLNTVATTLVLEQSIGLSLGHEEAVAEVEAQLARMDRVEAALTD